jgi:XTP/dITP diphosphohydrolase
MRKPAAPAPAPVRTLVFATRNAHKTAELEAHVAAVGLADVRVLTMDHAAALLGLEAPPEVDEDQPTFAGNASKKALAIAAWCKLPALADDSGLEVDALGGEPGVWSARWAAASWPTGTPHGSPAADAGNNAQLVARLAGVPREQRGARFRCVVALADPFGALGELTVTADGTCEGIILDAPRGAGGFGYDPLFYSPELQATFAEAPAPGAVRSKQEVSHRARAMAALAPQLRDYFLR